MNYYQYLKEAFRLCIVDSDEMWTCYLKPDWRYVLLDNELNPMIILNRDVSFEELEDTLKLEVERRKALTNYGPRIIKMIWDLGNEVVGDKTDSLLNKTVREIVSDAVLGNANMTTSPSVAAAAKLVPENISFTKKDIPNKENKN